VTVTSYKLTVAPDELAALSSVETWNFLADAEADQMGRVDEP